MYLERQFSIDESAEVRTEGSNPGGLYPDLEKMGLVDAQNVFNPDKENNLKDGHLYPDLEALFKENYFSVTFGPSPLKTDNSKLNNNPQKLTNKLPKVNNKDQTDGDEPKPKIRAHLKDKQCNKLSDKTSIPKEKRKTKRRHKHIKRGCKVLAFTVGLPITIPYLLIRTKPNKDDDDIESELDQLANSTASIFGVKNKSKAKKLRV